MDILEETTLRTSMIALAMAYIVLIVSTRNIILASLAVLVIVSIVFTVMAFVVWIGWGLGFIEGISIAIVIGLSVDFTVHYGHAYHESRYVVCAMCCYTCRMAVRIELTSRCSSL
jgi:protein dispatched 1